MPFGWWHKELPVVMTFPFSGSGYCVATEQEPSELILDLNEPHLANLMALRHAPLKVYRRLHRHGNLVFFRCAAFNEMDLWR
jgi:S-adenosylmethionine:diacylglycerol 3-amino-3-carboxypropyl transferase